MKKRILTAMAILMMAGSMMGQMVYTDEDAGINPRAEGTDYQYVMVPMQGLEIDQYEFVPLGGELLLLAAMGGGFLALKRRKKE